MSASSSHAAVNTRSSQQSSRLRISIVVPIRNEERFIGRTLDGLLSQEYPKHDYEILVVDGDSTDNTCPTVQSYVDAHQNIKLLPNPNRWSSSARNIGAKAASGDVVVIVDGHCQFADDQYFANIERAFQNPQVDCLGRPQPLDVDGGTSIQQAISLARSSRLGHHPDSFIYSDQEQKVPAHSVGVAYRKSVFDVVGEFDEAFDACEDVEFNHRVDQAQMHCVLAPSIQLRYYPRSSLAGLFRQMARYGRGRVRLFRKHQSTFSVKSLAPAIFLFCILAGLIPALISPILGTIYFGVLATYLVTVLSFSAALAIRAKNFGSFFWLPFVFFAIHFGAGSGSLKELFRIQDRKPKLDR